MKFLSFVLQSIFLIYTLHAQDTSRHVLSCIEVENKGVFYYLPESKFSLYGDSSFLPYETIDFAYLHYGNFIWGASEKDSIKIFRPTNGADLILLENGEKYTAGDTLLLPFQTEIIPVVLGFYNHIPQFYPFRILYTTLESNTLYINPMGQSILIQEEVPNFNDFNTNGYFLNERIPLSDSSGSYMLTSYSYANKSIDKIVFHELGFSHRKGGLVPPDLRLEKAKLLYFASTFCKPCIEEIPGIKALANELAKRAIDFTYILTDPDFSQVKSLEMERFIEKNDLKTLNPIAKHAVFNFFHVRQYPSYIFIDSSGRILYRSDETGQKFSDFLANFIKKDSGK